MEVIPTTDRQLHVRNSTTTTLTRYQDLFCILGNVLFVWYLFLDYEYQKLEGVIKLRRIADVVRIVSLRVS